jgi:hypothetical protein
MRKISFFALSGFIALSFSACTTEEYYTEEYTVDTYSQTYTVFWNMDHEYFWEEGDDQTGSYYFRTIKDPNLTNEIIQHGQMNAYFRYQPAKNLPFVLSPLPFSDFLLGTDNEGKPIKWEEQMTVEFEPGYITFILKADDHAPEPPFRDYYEFVVRFMW